METCHIHTSIEFEKIVPDDVQNTIAITRQRLAVQQLLDTGDNNALLSKRLGNYIEGFDAVQASLKQTTPLRRQPRFIWVVDSEKIESSCWKFEAVASRNALANLFTKEGIEFTKHDNYKDASKAFAKSNEVRKSILYILEGWTWKVPETNHRIVQKDWHVANIYHVKSLQDLCMLSVGIQKNSSSSACFTVSQRAVKHAALAVAHWPQMETALPLAEAMRYLFSADILWNQEQYGASIHRLESWLNASADTGHFNVLKEELEKVPFLLRERQQTNNTAYFDVVQSKDELCSPMELIHTGAIDVPHPHSSPHIQEPLEEDEPHVVAPEPLTS